MEKRQFNEFWEIKCPHCQEVLDIEILANIIKTEVAHKRIPVKR